MRQSHFQRPFKEATGTIFTVKYYSVHFSCFEVLYVVYMPVKVVLFSSLRMDFAVLAIILVLLQIMKMDWLVLPIFF